MLKTNLIAIIGLALVLAGNALAQGDKNDERPIEAVRAKIKNPKTVSLKSPRDVSTGQSSGIKQNASGSSRKAKPKPVNLGDTGTHESGYVKAPRNTASGQRSAKRKFEPVASYEGATYAGNFSFNAIKGKTATERKTTGYIGETEKNLKKKPQSRQAQDKMGNFEIQRVNAGNNRPKQ